MKSLPLLHPLTLLTCCATWASQRMRPASAAVLFLLVTLAMTQSGCMTLGPVTEVRYVIVHPGQPVKILKNVTVTGERLDGGGHAELNIGGWVAMPPDHWSVIEKMIKDRKVTP